MSRLMNGGAASSDSEDSDGAEMEQLNLEAVSETADGWDGRVSGWDPFKNPKVFWCVFIPPKTCGL